MNDQPVCVDLCCGYGGWTDAFLELGYRVVGFDLARRVAAKYRGELVLQDIRTLDGRRLSRLNPRVFVASPPCTDFTFVKGRRRDLAKGMVLVREARRVIQEADPPYWVIENVRGAFGPISAELGPPMNRGGMHNASTYLWGRLPPMILPRVRKGWRREPGPASTFTTTEPPSKDSWENSRVAYAIAHAVAEACLP